MLWSQRFPLQELIAVAILKGEVEVRGTAMVLEHLEIPQLVCSVDNQFRLPAVDTHQDSVPHLLVREASHELVGDAIGEELREE